MLLTQHPGSTAGRESITGRLLSFMIPNGISKDPSVIVGAAEEAHLQMQRAEEISDGAIAVNIC